MKWLSTAVKSVVEEALDRYGVDPEKREKSPGDYVTTLDLAIDRGLRARFASEMPGACYRSEEGEAFTLTPAPTWVVDPLDGTFNYVKGHPFYGVQGTYFEGRRPQSSFIYLPAQSLFLETHGKGLLVNGSPYRREPVAGEQALVTFGDFSRSNPSSHERQLSMMRNLIGKVNKVRIQGASSVDFGFVAAGISDAHVSFSTRSWELESGAHLVEAAGGVVHPLPGGGVVVAADAGLARLILELAD